MISDLKEIANATKPISRNAIASYKSVPGTTKIAKTSTDKRFSAGCDKWYISGKGNLNLSLIEGFRTTKALSARRYYRCLGSSGHFKIETVDIYVFQNSTWFEVQLNPNQFESYHFMDELLKVILGAHYDTARSIKLHVHVDIKHPIEEVIEGMVVTRRKCSTAYTRESYSRKKSGVVTEISETKGFGSKGDQIKIYDASKKHGLPYPTTRIERQADRASKCLVRSVSEFPKLGGVKPFDHVKVYSILDKTLLRGRDRERFKLLRCLAKRNGLQEAIAELRRDDPKHFYRNYKTITNLLETKRVCLQSSFINRMRGFLKRSMSESEKVLLADIASGKHKSST
jgi:hypothetical protein